MDKTPGQVLHSQFSDDEHEWEHLRESTREQWESDAAAVISHVTPQIRAAAIEDAILRMTTFHPTSNQCIRTGASHITWERVANTLADEIRALAPLPPGHVCVPTRPERERINAGAERLLRWQEDTKPEDFSALQWAEARQDAERVYLSMVQYGIAAAKEPK